MCAYLQKKSTCTSRRREGDRPRTREAGGKNGADYKKKKKKKGKPADALRQAAIPRKKKKDDFATRLTPDDRRGKRAAANSPGVQQ